MLRRDVAAVVPRRSPAPEINVTHTVIPITTLPGRTREERGSVTDLQHFIERGGNNEEVQRSNTLSTVGVSGENSTETAGVSGANSTETQRSASADEPPHPPLTHIMHGVAEQSFIGGSNHNAHPESSAWKIAACALSTIIASGVGTEFGLLSIKDESELFWKIFRFFSSFTVNFAGSLVAIQDIFSLCLKLKQDADPVLKRAFIAASLLTLFAVVSTVPLALDSVSGITSNQKGEAALKALGAFAWCVGYVAVTRLEGGTSLLKLIYEFLRKKPDINLGPSVPLVAETGFDLPETALKASRCFLMLGSLFMAPILGYEADRGWSELTVRSPITRYVLDAPSTLAALIFFVRSAQLLTERSLGVGKNLYNQFQSKGEMLARIATTVALVSMLGIAFGSCFGWLYEAQEFAQNKQTPFAKVAFPGYKYIVALYGALANLGFIFNLLNKCCDFSEKNDVSLGRALAHRLTGLGVFARKPAEPVGAHSPLLVGNT